MYTNTVKASDVIMKWPQIQSSERSGIIGKLLSARVKDIYTCLVLIL